jgi:hypothetical protein
MCSIMACRSNCAVRLSSTRPAGFASAIPGRMTPGRQAFVVPAPPVAPAPPAFQPSMASPVPVTPAGQAATEPVPAVMSLAAKAAIVGGVVVGSVGAVWAIHHLVTKDS